MKQGHMLHAFAATLSRCLVGVRLYWSFSFFMFPIFWPEHFVSSVLVRGNVLQHGGSARVVTL